MPPNNGSTLSVPPRCLPRAVQMTCDIRRRALRVGRFVTGHMYVFVDRHFYIWCLNNQIWVVVEVLSNNMKKVRFGQGNVGVQLHAFLLVHEHPTCGMLDINR